MKQNLSDIQGPTVQQSSLRDLATYIEVEPIQKDKTNGIEIGLSIINHGNQEVSLVNPFNLLQFQVMDDAGYPLKIPTKPPNLLINTKNSEEEFDPPLKVIRLLQNGQAEEIGKINEKTLNLAINEEYEVFFEIDRFLEKQSEHNSSGEGPQSVDIGIPNGVYTVRCTATLINSSNTQESRILQSSTIQIDFAKRE